MMPLLPNPASLLTVRSTTMGITQEPVYASSSFDPLPEDLRHGMMAMGALGLLSTISTLSLLIFITYRMIYWRRYYEHPIATNQIFVLIYNLLLADFQQALSFLLAFHWIAQDKLVGPTPACFAQGWLIQIGDLSSGLWVLAIAVHTFISLVGQKHIPMVAFVIAVVAIWVFALIMTAIGPILNGMDFFVPAGAWCWISDIHERDRLTLHYLWIFISQLGSLVIYTTIFFYLRMRVASTIKAENSTSQTSSTEASNNFSRLGMGVTTTTIVSQQLRDPFAISRQRILRTARYMVVYPFAYVALTLPLAAGRVSAMAHKSPPLMFYCVAGTLMASCGIIDVALYIYTRKALVKSSIGLKVPQLGGDRLTRFKTVDSRRPGAGAQNIRMSGIANADLDDDGRSKEHAMAKGAIIVSKSVTRSEDSCSASTEGPRYRSDSMKSLVVKKDEQDSDKTWLA